MPDRTWIVSLALALSAACTSRPSDPIPAIGDRGPADLAPGRDSVVRLEDGTLAMLPFARLELEALGECSGLVWQGGAFFANNDSGDAPVLYRSTALDFAEAEVLPVPGAMARDWEDVGTIGDDLLVFDIGDNDRERDDLVIYRVQYRAGSGGEPSRLDRLATYPIAYPNGHHDAEAGFSIDGVVHVVSKSRGEGTFVYRFDTLVDASDLDPGTRNVPTLTGTLDVGDGEMVTAGTFDPDSDEVLLLTYSGLLTYPARALAGAPATRMRLWARQCEALCLHDGRIVITNEEWDVFVVEAHRARSSDSLTPPRARLTLSSGAMTPIPLYDASAGDALAWRREGDALQVEFAFTLDDTVAVTSIDPVRLGGAILLVFGTHETTRTGAADTFVAVGKEAGGTYRVWRGDGAGGPGALSAFDAATVTAGIDGRSGHSVLTGEIVLPLPDVVANGDSFLFDLRTFGLRDGDGPYVSGLGAYSMYRPYTWAVVNAATPVSG